MLKAEFFFLAQTGLETALRAGSPHRGRECRQRLWISITGSLSMPRLAGMRSADIRRASTPREAVVTRIRVTSPARAAARLSHPRPAELPVIVIKSL